jgi:hypothetical protein
MLDSHKAPNHTHHKSGSSLDPIKREIELNKYDLESSKVLPGVSPTLLSNASALKHHQNKLAAVASTGSLSLNTTKTQLPTMVPN